MRSLTIEHMPLEVLLSGVDLVAAAVGAGESPGRTFATGAFVGWGASQAAPASAFAYPHGARRVGLMGCHWKSNIARSTGRTPA